MAETSEKCSKCKSLFVEPNVIKLAKQFVTSIDSIEKLLFLPFLGKIMIKSQSLLLKVVKV